MALLLCERQQNWLRVVTVVFRTIGIYVITSTFFLRFLRFFWKSKKSWLFTFFCRVSYVFSNYAVGCEASRSAILATAWLLVFKFCLCGGRIVWYEVGTVIRLTGRKISNEKWMGFGEIPSNYGREEQGPKDLSYWVIYLWYRQWSNYSIISEGAGKYGER